MSNFADSSPAKRSHLPFFLHFHKVSYLALFVRLRVLQVQMNKCAHGYPNPWLDI